MVRFVPEKWGRSPQRSSPRASPQGAISEFVAALILGVLASLSAFALAGFSAWLIVRAWQRPTPLQLTIAVVSVRALGISRALFRYGERIMTHKLLFHRRSHILQKLYLQQAERGFSTRPITGNYLLSLAYSIADKYALILVPTMIAVIIASITIVVFAQISVHIALIMAIALILATLVVPAMSYFLQKKSLDQATCMFNEFLRMIALILEHREELVTTGAIGFYLHKARELLLLRDKNLGKSYSMQAVVMALQILIIGLTELACILQMYTLQIHISAPVTGVLMLLPLMSFEVATSLAPVIQQLLLYTTAQKLLTVTTSSSYRQQAQHLAEAVMNVAPSLATMLRSTNTDPKLSNAANSVADDRLPESANSIAVLTGPNGSGKTSVLLSFLSLLESETCPNMDSMLLLSNSHIFDTSILQNLLLIQPQANRHECQNVLEKVGLWSCISALTLGMDTNAKILSQGQKKLLSLAQFLLAQPQIGLLDEPTVNLSPEKLDIITEILLDKSMATNRIIATHDAQLISKTGTKKILTVDLKTDVLSDITN